MMMTMMMMMMSVKDFDDDTLNFGDVYNFFSIQSGALSSPEGVSMDSCSMNLVNIYVLV